MSDSGRAIGECRHGNVRATCSECAVARLEAENARLRKQFPEGMENCTIVFRECEKGHGWLTATNWVQHGCPTCERDALIARVREIMTAGLELWGMASVICNSLDSRDKTYLIQKLDAFEKVTK